MSDKDQVVATVHELLAEWAAGPPASWENRSLPDYLEALAAWLTDCDGYYANRSVPVPEDGWEIMRAALRAATMYE